MIRDGYKDKVINPHQVGGIETYVCDNGVAKGSRVAWVNTGSGLRFKVAIDRGLDIVDAFYNDCSLSWLSHKGLGAPRPDIIQGAEWLVNFSGGLLTTCGLSHVGGPDENERGVFGVHDRYSNLPAELESVVQPCIRQDEFGMSISGVVRQSGVFGPNLELKRTISCRLGEPVINIRDTVTNVGNTETPLMLLYHCNFGWPLVDEGTRIVYEGSCEPHGNDGMKAVFNDENDNKICRAPLEEHSGSGEAVGFIDPKADDSGLCTAGLCNDKLGMAVLLKFRKDQLPCLTNWQHWGRGEYICGVEPGTNFPVGQSTAEEQENLTLLQPLESKAFDLGISVLSGLDNLKNL